MSDKESLKPVIESLIFASDSALPFEKIANVLEGEEKDVVRAALHELVDDYKNAGRGILIEEVAGGYQFRTHPDSSPWLRKFFKIGLQKISKAAMESLAVIAYKQPVTRGELEAVRGVDSGGVLATLMEKRCIKIVGRKEVPGRPVVYGTTKEFLEMFDLKDLSCLPSLKDIQKMEEENDKNASGEQISQDSSQDTVQNEAPGQSGNEEQVQEPDPDGPEGEPRKKGQDSGPSDPFEGAFEDDAGEPDEPQKEG